MNGMSDYRDLYWHYTHLWPILFVSVCFSTFQPGFDCSNHKRVLLHYTRYKIANVWLSPLGPSLEWLGRGGLAFLQTCKNAVCGRSKTAVHLGWSPLCQQILPVWVSSIGSWVCCWTAPMCCTVSASSETLVLDSSRYPVDCVDASFLCLWSFHPEEADLLFH